MRRGHSSAVRPPLDLPVWSYHGFRLNASRIGSSMAIDVKTVLSLRDDLQGAFLIRRPQPYATDMTERLVKTPRVLWRDTGLLNALVEVAGLEHLCGRAWLGQTDRSSSSSRRSARSRLRTGGQLPTASAPPTVMSWIWRSTGAPIAGPSRSS